MCTWNSIASSFPVDLLVFVKSGKLWKEKTFVNMNWVNKTFCKCTCPNFRFPNKFFPNSTVLLYHSCKFCQFSKPARLKCSSILFHMYIVWCTVRYVALTHVVLWIQVDVGTGWSSVSHYVLWSPLHARDSAMAGLPREDTKSSQEPLPRMYSMCRSFKVNTPLCFFSLVSH